MKKTLAGIFLLFFSIMTCFASTNNLGVSVIGSKNTAKEKTSLDNLTIGEEVEVPGWANITATSYEVQDCIMVRKPGQLGRIWCWNSNGSHSGDDYNNLEFNLEVTCELHQIKDFPWWTESWVSHYFSKSEADYVVLYMDIVNTTAQTVDFIKNCTVKVVFEDIEYLGWYYQQDFDLNRAKWIDVSDVFSIGPYYTGHYVFGCTLPNAVIQSTKPLKMIVTIDGNELTYNIRK